MLIELEQHEAAERHSICRIERRVALDLIRHVALVGVALQQSTTPRAPPETGLTYMSKPPLQTAVPPIALRLPDHVVQRRMRRLTLLEEALRAELVREQHEEALTIVDAAFDRLSDPLRGTYDDGWDALLASRANVPLPASVAPRPQQFHPADAAPHVRSVPDRQARLDLSVGALREVADHSTARWVVDTTASGVVAPWGESPSTSFVAAPVAAAAAVGASFIREQLPTSRRSSLNVTAALPTASFAAADDVGYDSVALGAHVDAKLRVFPCKVRPHSNARVRRPLVSLFAIHPGDVLAAINGVRVHSVSDVASWEEAFDPTVADAYLTLIRNERRHAVTVSMSTAVDQ